MKNSHPSKKKPEEIQRSPLVELPMTERDWKDFGKGIDLFNEGKFWHAHEAWEEVWKRHSEDERLFLQGLIQAAAAYHQLTTDGNYRGLLNNFEKARAKLDVFVPEYLGVSLGSLLLSIQNAKVAALKLGEENIQEFEKNLIPKLQYQKPGDPDFIVEAKIMLESPRFHSGVKLFNSGYFWEAHEEWEEVWRGFDMHAKTFAHAFVQMAEAYSFAMQKKLSCAKYLFEKSISEFQQFEHEKSGIAVTTLIVAMKETLVAIENSISNGNVPLKNISLPSLDFS